MSPLPPRGTVAAIYSAYEAEARDEERTYLGMSTMGNDCDRALWYAFRWAAAPERFDGRMLRLFQTGHWEEVRLIADLQRAGIIVSQGESGQIAVASVGGHFRGHLDGEADNVPEAPKTTHVLECKTHNQKSFDALVLNGVAISKPGHWRQMQLYMHHRGRERALYVAENKNDEGIYVERVEYDPVAALQLVARAERIVRSDRPPSKLHDDPTAKIAFVCGYCAARSICHEGDAARRNCRTCLHATPIVDGGTAGRWCCERFNRDLAVADQRTGCPGHRYIPDLVPGEQIDAAEDGLWIEYRMPDGSNWIDGERAEIAA